MLIRYLKCGHGVHRHDRTAAQMSVDAYCHKCVMLRKRQLHLVKSLVVVERRKRIIVGLDDDK